MKVLEIKNNLVKISYTHADNLILSGFVIIEDEQSPYVAQILSLKADNGTNYAIVKLLFTFDEEGIVKNYDGTIPSLDSEITKLSSDELLDILPVKSPVNIGLLANQNCELKVDRSIFEQNLLVCSENADNTATLIENFVLQLSNENQKSIIFDIDGKFAGPSLKFGEDFKLPLNYDTINFIYEHDLDNVDPASKALIQDIFLEVQEYSKTVLDKFIPFDTFISVVDQQYKETGITELVLLKNKLLKYKEENVFAQNAKEIHSLRSAIRANLTNVLDISSANDILQNEIIKYVYDAIDEMDLFVYSFVQFTNDNADKKLIRHFLTKDKIYTTIICSHNYKYLYELKERANNLILFTPLTMQHDFATYNTFLNKLNPDEFIIYGKSTQCVPLIIELSSLIEPETPEEVPDQSVDESDYNEQNTQPEEDNVEKPDDFSEESNSYSYETLISDDVSASVEQAKSEETPEKRSEQSVVEESEETPEKKSEQSVVEESEETPEKKSEQSVVEESEETPEKKSEQSVVEESGEELEPQEISNIIDKEIAAEQLPQTPENEEEVIEEVVEPKSNSNNLISDTEDTEEQDALPDVLSIPETQATEIPQLEEIIEENETENYLTESYIMESEELPMPVIEYQDDSLPIISDEELANKIEENVVLPIRDNAAEVVDEIMFSKTSNVVPSIEEELEDENLTEDDLNFIEDVNIGTPEIAEELNVPVFPAETPVRDDVFTFEQGDKVSHPKYGEGIVEKMIKYGNKTLCSINFANIGRRLLDPAISEIEKL